MFLGQEQMRHLAKCLCPTRAMEATESNISPVGTLLWTWLYSSSGNQHQSATIQGHVNWWRCLNISFAKFVRHIRQFWTIPGRTISEKTPESLRHFCWQCVGDRSTLSAISPRVQTQCVQGRQNHRKTVIKRKTYGPVSGGGATVPTRRALSATAELNVSPLDRRVDTCCRTLVVGTSDKTGDVGQLELFLWNTFPNGFCSMLLFFLFL